MLAVESCRTMRSRYFDRFCGRYFLLEVETKEEAEEKLREEKMTWTWLPGDSLLCGGRDCNVGEKIRTQI